MNANELYSGLSVLITQRPNEQEVAVVVIALTHTGKTVVRDSAGILVEINPTRIIKKFD